MAQQQGHEETEDNGEVRKMVEGDFGEKRLLGGYVQLIGSLQEAYTNLGRLVQNSYVND